MTPRRNTGVTARATTTADGGVQRVGRLRTTLFGTVRGAIGVIASIDGALFARLKRIEAALAAVVRGVGALDWAHWRRFRNNYKSIDAHGFVDGDLLQLYTELAPLQQAQVAAAVELSTAQLSTLLEQLIAAMH